MSGELSNSLEVLKGYPGALQSIFRGLEKEGLRTSADGMIAATDHPHRLGSALTHPAITTDYSEALLELITPVYGDPEALLRDLADLHNYVYTQLPANEIIWAGSMPCGIQGEESIRIADYGHSNSGRLKHIYRIGLALRYGRIMQSIAGLHYNFSLGDDFWKALHNNGVGPEFNSQHIASNAELNLQDFKTAGYFSLIRNFRRWSWLLMYLFGASPVLDESFLDGKPHRLQKLAHNTFGLPYATSLRMSDLGYQNNAQSSLKICFNHLSSYTKTLFGATHTPYPKYQKTGVIKDGNYLQLNTNLLQIENEYYNSIRPKRVTLAGEKPLQALERRGVEYIEVRCLDINPFLPVGIDSEQIRFLDTFLLTCLLDKSPLVSDAECEVVEKNFARIVEQGRSPDCRLLSIEQGKEQETGVASSGQEIIEKMMKVAAALDENRLANVNHSATGYVATVAAMRQRLLHPETTPSAKVLAAVKENGSYLGWLLKVSQQHKSTFLANQLTAEALQEAQRISEQSWEKERELREHDRRSFAQYLSDFLDS